MTWPMGSTRSSPRCGMTMLQPQNETPATRTPTRKENAANRVLERLAINTFDIKSEKLRIHSLTPLLTRRECPRTEQAATKGAHASAVIPRGRRRIGRARRPNRAGHRVRADARAANIILPELPLPRSRIRGSRPRQNQRRNRLSDNQCQRVKRLGLRNRRRPTPPLLRPLAHELRQQWPR